MMALTVAQCANGQGAVRSKRGGRKRSHGTPHITPAVVKGLIDRRPFMSVVDLDRCLREQKLTAEQAAVFCWERLSTSISNNGTREEFVLIPARSAEWRANRRIPRA